MKPNKFPMGVVLCLLCGLLSQAQGIEFKTDNWHALKERAKEENKLIFVDVYTVWCGPCVHMDKKVFSDERVGVFFNTNFIPFKINAEKGEGPDFSREYNIASYPTLLFVDGNGRQILRKGSMDVEELLQLGRRAIDSEKDFAEITKAYNEGQRTPELILKYLSTLKERALPTEDVLISYLTDFEKKQWGSMENLKLIDKYVQGPYNEVIEYLIQHRGGFAKSPAESRWVNYIVRDVYKRYLVDAINKGRDAKIVDKLLSHANLRLTKTETARLDLTSKRLVAKRDKDWDSYIKHTIDYVNGYLTNRNSSLNNFAWEFYRNEAIKDKRALEEALKWVDMAIQNSEDYYNAMDTKAALLYKLGKKEEALIAANQALNTAKKTGEDPSETFKLIEKIKAL